MQEYSHKDFVEKLKAARKNKFKTQEEISSVLGIKRGTYARYETNAQPPLQIFYKICQVLNVSADELLEPFEINEPDEAEES